MKENLSHSFYNLVKNHWTTTTVILTTILLVLNMLIFYPGYMSADSLTQLGQSLGINPVGDWHPVVMALVWKILIHISAHVSSMLLLQLALFWSGMCLLSIVVFTRTGSRRVSLAPLLVGLLPFVICISGVIWKDVQMAYALTLAACLIIVLYYRLVENKVTRWVLIVIALFLVFYAILLRYNAIPAAIPVLLLLLNEVAPRVQLKVKLSIVLVATVVCALGGAAIIDRVMGAEKENPFSSVMLDDIINIRTANELRLMSRSKSVYSDMLQIQSTCSDKRIVMNSYWLCSDDTQRDNIHKVYYEQTKNYWLKSIMAHPFRYFVYKVETFTMFLVASDQHVEQYGIDPNMYHQEVLSTKIQYTLYVYVVQFGYEHFSFLFQPWFWLGVGIYTLWYSAKKLRDSRYMVICLSLSSLLYILSYAPVVVAVEYRYIFWSVLALVIAWIIIGADFVVKRADDYDDRISEVVISRRLVGNRKKEISDENSTNWLYGICWWEY
jgi:hypothetical protein